MRNTAERLQGLRLTPDPAEAIAARINALREYLSEGSGSEAERGEVESLVGYWRLRLAACLALRD
jgi:hypothetical protein